MLSLSEAELSLRGGRRGEPSLRPSRSRSRPRSLTLVRSLSRSRSRSRSLSRSRSRSRSLSRSRSRSLSLSPSLSRSRSRSLPRSRSHSRSLISRSLSRASASASSGMGTGPKAPTAGVASGTGTGPVSGRGVGSGSRGCVGRLRTRMSLRMRILIPWSASEQESGVDSAIRSLIISFREPSTWTAYLPCPETSSQYRRRTAPRKSTCSDRRLNCAWHQYSCPAR